MTRKPATKRNPASADKLPEGLRRLPSGRIQWRAQVTLANGLLMAAQARRAPLGWFRFHEHHALNILQRVLCPVRKHHDIGFPLAPPHGNGKVNGHVGQADAELLGNGMRGALPHLLLGRVLDRPGRDVVKDHAFRQGD